MVTPLNPNSASISVNRSNYPTTASPSALAPAVAKETSLSIITPPPVTAKILEEAKSAGIRAVWLQPGSFDNAVLDQAKRLFPGNAVGGTEDGGGDLNGGEGWCVLVHGDEAIRAAGQKGRL